MIMVLSTVYSSDVVYGGLFRSCRKNEYLQASLHSYSTDPFEVCVLVLSVPSFSF